MKCDGVVSTAMDGLEEFFVFGYMHNIDLSISCTFSNPLIANIFEMGKFNKCNKKIVISLLPLPIDIDKNSINLN